MEQFAQLSAEELQPLDHVIHIGLLIEGTVAIRIVCKKSGYDRFAILQQGNRQIENIAGSVQSLHIVPRVIPEQIAEGLNCSLQNIRIILFKGSGEIIFKQADVKRILGVFLRMIGIESYNCVLGFRISEDLSRVLVGVTDGSGSLNRDADAATQCYIIVILQCSADALQNVCQTFHIIIGIGGIRKAENQCKMAQIQRQRIKRQIFSPQFPYHL